MNTYRSIVGRLFSKEKDEEITITRDWCLELYDEHDNLVRIEHHETEGDAVLSGIKWDKLKPGNYHKIYYKYNGMRRRSDVDLKRYELEVSLDVKCYGDVEYKLYLVDEEFKYDIEGFSNVVFTTDPKVIPMKLTVTVYAEDEDDALWQVATMFRSSKGFELEATHVETAMVLEDLKVKDIKVRK